MTKKNAFKIATALMLFVFTAGMLTAQEIPAQYGLVSDDDGLSRITIGRAMPFYVEPDATFHPNYNAGDPAWQLTPGFSWTWSPADLEGWILGEVDSPLALENPAGNYVEIRALTVGDYDVTVKERTPEAWGGCEDEGGTTMTVRVVEAPEMNSYSATIESDAVIFSENVYQQCGAITGFNASVNLTGFPKFQVRYSLVRREIDVNGLVTGDPDETLADGAEAALGADNSLIRVTGSDYVFDTRDLTLIDGNKRTRYIYTITGVTDHVSRRSDFLEASTTWYDVGDPLTFTVIVNPTPVTGPIFHIPDNHNAL